MVRVSGSLSRKLGLFTWISSFHEKELGRGCFRRQPSQEEQILKSTRRARECRIKTHRNGRGKFLDKWD
jgi:hypothetical protein